ncbi:hypothetical protein [Niabella yanshanensis]|uniref:hypothetical protein n=1 Tax=Niabella yanshanensis TaxID=577386 RepID=UPI001B85FBBA|nr:hypothetical protein [Niabella yanshanensis]
MKQRLCLLQRTRTTDTRPKYSSVDNLMKTSCKTSAAKDQHEPHDTAAMRSPADSWQ